MGDGEKRRVRSGEVKRSEFAEARKLLPVHCRGIAALAMYVNTVDGMKWRCNRCGQHLSFVREAREWLDTHAPEITANEARVFMTLASLMRTHAVH